MARQQDGEALGLSDVPVPTLVWALVAAAAGLNLAVGVVLALRQPARASDLFEMYDWCRTWLLGQHQLYAGPDASTDYPPNAIVMLSPLALVPWRWVVPIWTAVALALTPLLPYLVVRCTSHRRLFTAAAISQSTSLITIVETLAHKQFVLYPSMAFAAVAFIMVLLAENARIPVDNPSTHLELTMIHEAMILEYSARHLALVEWASALKLLAYMTIGIALFAPWGIAESGDWKGLPLAVLLVFLKLLIGGFVLALLETLSAKMRIFRVPEFMGTAFLLAVLGLLTHFLLGSGA